MGLIETLGNRIRICRSNLSNRTKHRQKAHVLKGFYNHSNHPMLAFHASRDKRKVLIQEGLSESRGSDFS